MICEKGYKGRLVFSGFSIKKIVKQEMTNPELGITSHEINDTGSTLWCWQFGQNTCCLPMA
jgi:hypothetical protein